MKTESLIDRLSGNAVPVRPLPDPWRRAMLWAVASLPYLVLIAFAFGFRTDLSTKIFEPRFVVEQLAALATGFTAAVAAFALVVPGRSKRYFLLPILPLTIWLGSVGFSCFQELSHSDVRSVTFHADWLCLPGIVLSGLLPGVLIVFMLWRGAPLFPYKSAALAGLAAAGLGDFGFRLFHPEDAGFIVLAWHMGTVLILTGLAASSGKYILNWRRVAGTKSLKPM